MPSAERACRLAVGAALLAGLCGCSSPLTELIVDVHSDLAVPSALDEIVVTTESANGVLKEARASLVDATSFPVTVGLRPGSDENASVTVHVTGLLDGAQQVAAHVSTHFIAGERRVLRIDLTADCIDDLCLDDETCRRGACVSRVVAPSTLPQYTGTLPGRDDAGVAPSDAGHGDAEPTDAGSTDASPGDANTVDAPPGCTDNAACSDGDPCNGVEVCDTGVCLPGTPLNCDDGVGCTLDTCTAGACVHTPADAACIVSPGGTCDAVYGCQYDSCTPTTCASDGCSSAMCLFTLCERTSLCTGATSMCCGNACVAAGCDDGNPCTADACAPAGCTHTPTVGAPCSDGDACTRGDACTAAGTCAGAASTACDDYDQCTDDSCDSRSGCVYTAHTRACEDGDACTTGEACTGGVCSGGVAVVCFAGECERASCDPAFGCSTVSLAPGTRCDDGDNCTSNDRCAGGACTGTRIAGCVPY